MQIKQLRQLLTIADCGSLHLAARKLGMSQPAVTKSMRNLEDELGVPLLIRGARGSTLTHFGASLLPRIRNVDAELKTALEEIAAMRGDSRNSLSVAVSPVAAMALLPASLNLFRLRSPESRLTILDGLQPSGAALLRAGTVDLYLGTLESGEAGRDLKAEQLFPNDVVVTCRIGNPWSGARSLKDLGGASWLGGIVTPRRESIRRIFAQHGLPNPRSVTYCESFISLVSIVAMSDLLTTLPVHIHKSGLFKSTLMPIPIRERLEIPAVGILRRADAPTNTLKTSFIRAVRQASRMHV